MSSSPSPEEREAKDKADRAREAEEQAKLPYKWTQTIKDVDITVPVPGNYKGRDIIAELNKESLKVGVKGQDPIIDVSQYAPQNAAAQRFHPTLSLFIHCDVSIFDVVNVKM